jgi:hypothetical protein
MAGDTDDIRPSRARRNAAAGNAMLNHCIGTQQIEIRARSEEGAYPLVERVGEANRTRWLSIIERVLDDHDRPGEIIRMERLDLDLGRVAEMDLGALDARLERALREALRSLIPVRASAALEHPAPGPGPVIVGEGAGLVEGAEHWLLHGSWPYDSALARDTRPDALIARLIEEEPVALVAMLGRRRGSHTLVRRLVRQLGEELLERLLHQLEPQSAAWIIGYVAETRAVHAAAPLIDQPAEPFGRTVWEIVIRDSLQRAGLRANRRAFVRQLIASVAAAAGASFSALLEELTRALSALPEAAGRPDNLLSVLKEIGGPEEPDVTAGAEAVPEASSARFTRWMAGADGLNELAEASAADPALVRRLLREAARKDRRLIADRLRYSPVIEPLPRLLLPNQLADAANAFLGVAGCSTEEAALLLAAAAAMPAGTPDELLVQSWTQMLAASRGVQPGELSRALEGRAGDAGGDSGRRLRTLLPEARANVASEASAPVRREAALIALRHLLSGDASAAIIASVQGLLPVLAGIDAEDLRLRLAGDARPSKPAALTLRQVDRATLERLIALLAPSPSSARSQLQRRLRDAGGRVTALAAIVSELLAHGEVNSTAAPSAPTATSADKLAVALENARRIFKDAVEQGGAALRAPSFQRAAALLAQRRPFEVLRILGALPGSGLAAGAAALFQDRSAAALLFGALDERDRAEGAALLRRLTGPAGRLAISSGTVAQAVLRAAVRSLGRRRPASLVEELIGALFELATTAERRDLAGLLGRTPAPGIARAPSARRAEKGSAEWLAENIGRGTVSEPALAAALRSTAYRRLLARHWPRSWLVRLLLATRPGEARALLQAADAMAVSLRSGGGRLSEEEYWDALLKSASSPRGHAVQTLLGAFLDLRRVEAGALLEAAVRSRPAELADAAAERLRQKPKRKTLQAPPPPAHHLRADTAPSPALPPAAEMAIANAGLVLTAPYLPTLFERLSLIERDPSGRAVFRSTEAAERAVHLLQYLVDGRCDAPEPLLPLNKLLCGLAPEWPVAAAIVASNEELEICRSLLGAMLEAWPMLRGSSVDALRETFFQRDGRLTRVEAGRKLEVERKVLDVMLDGIPWSYSLIFHPWMPEPLEVIW